MLNPDPNTNVQLPNDVARCAPSNPCDSKETCARFVAPVPPNGTIMDGSYAATSYGCRCHHYIEVTPFRLPPPKLRKTEKKREVKKPLRGM